MLYKKALDGDCKRIIDLWDNLINDLQHNYRFFTESELIIDINRFLLKHVEKIRQGTSFYRARIFSITENYKGKEPFWGYDEENSFINKKHNEIQDGRVNPYSISYLYLAETVYTACAEVRPYLNDYISVAEIQNKEDLKIIDISEDIDREYESSAECFLASLITRTFSQPIKNKGANYLITQYISEYIKKLGFDGIKFSSSLDKNGVNLTVFNYEKCRVLNSSLYQFTDWTMKFDKKQPVEQHPENLDEESIDIEFKDGSKKSATVLAEFWVEKYNNRYIAYYFPDEDIYEIIRNSSDVASVLEGICFSIIKESDEQEELHPLPVEQMTTMNRLIRIITKLANINGLDDSDLEFIEEIGFEPIIQDDESNEDDKEGTDEDDEFITVMDALGNEMTFELLLEFESEVTGKRYIIYTDNKEDDNGNVGVFSSIVDTKEMTLKSLESEEDEELIKDILEDLMHE